MPTTGLLRWVADAVGGGATVVRVDGLRNGGAPWRVRLERGGRVVDVVLRVGRRDGRGLLATEAAALTLAQQHGLAAPRLLDADLDGAVAGCPAVLMTALRGDSQIPAVASPARLRTLGAAAAAIHAVPVAPCRHLPARERPLADVDFAARRTVTGSSPLLDTAQRRLDELPVPHHTSRFVHGDLWQGNTVWNGDTLVGLLDWDAAGVGQPGIDLGTLRNDAAILFGPAAADHILHGWQQITGRTADDVPYWDIVAALTTSTDMARWLPVAREHGRGDLGAITLNRRRDDFLHAALDQFGRTPTLP